MLGTWSVHRRTAAAAAAAAAGGGEKMFAISRCLNETRAVFLESLLAQPAF